VAVVSGGLFESIFTTDAILDATSDRTLVRAMLDFEAALAKASAAAGVVPADAAEEIVKLCESVELDPVALGRAGRIGGNPVIPLVAELRDRLAEPAVGWVHFGSTSQDALDTALVLVSRSVIDLVVEDLRRAADAAARLASDHRLTPMAARTLLQQALPTSFGAVAAGWLVALVESGDRLAEARRRCAALQLGGPAGTLASLGDDGLRVVEGVAAELDLAVPVLPWHTDRTRVAEIAAALGLAAGACGKVATDVALMMQTEVGEVTEPQPGGSSALPHKQNPAISARVVAGARRAPALVSVLIGSMAQEHQRAAGAWHAEWQTLVELLRAAGGAAAGVADLLTGLKVHEAAMARNLALSGGLILSERATFELAKKTAHVDARRRVEEAIERSTSSGTSLAEELPDIPAETWDPAGWLGSAGRFVDRALETYRR
jgi:3-carboxy-cis,cis-muconate cycloisomerase